MTASDTSEAAQRVHDDVYRAMTPVQRVELAIQMSEELREVTLSGIRARSPGLSDREVLDELLVVLHGAALADRLADGRR